jgi:hypothetical protein
MGRKRIYETTEYAGMMKRLVTAYGRRVGDADVEDLGEMLALQAHFQDVVAQAVQAQREVHGRSWADIAQAAGTTRQAAQMKWGKPKTA